MLSKKRFLTTFCLILFCVSRVQAAQSWEVVVFEQVIHSDQYLLSDGKKVQLWGVTGLDLENPSHRARCLTENLKINLPLWLRTPKLKMKVIQSSKAVPLVQIKFGKQDLAEHLLYLGLAASDTKAPKHYLDAQKKAQQAHRGIWGQCDPHLPIIKWQKQRGRTPWFWDRYHLHLQAGSMGQVVQVLNGNTLVLADGLKVQLEGILVPELGSDKISHQCFAEQSHQYLEKLVLGHQIYLLDTPNPIYKYKTTSRQVYLPKTRWRPAIWLNQGMIENGYGRADPSIKNQALTEAELAQFKNPSGAWAKCAHLAAQETIDQYIPEPKKVAPPPLPDTNCPIKGNVAGSKKNPKKTYHTVLSGWYQRLEAEACFDTEAEAEAAGFVKVK